MKKLIIGLNFIILLAAAFQVDAATISSIKSASASTTKKLSTKTSPTPATSTPSTLGFSGSVNVSRYGSMVDHQDGTRYDSLDTTANFAYEFSTKYKLSSLFYYSQNLKTDKGDWDELILSFSHAPIGLYSRLLVSPALLGMIPMSKDANFRQEFKGGLGAGLRFSFAPNTFVGGLDFKFSVSLYRNFFEAETATDGKPNSEYSSIQKITASHTYKKISSSIVFYHINALTYQNNIKESFMHFEEIGYNFTDSFSLAVGHGNIGSGLKPNGQDNNILITDENSSVLYVSSTLNF